MGASLHEAIRFRLSPTPPTVRRIARYHYGIELLRGWRECARFAADLRRRMRIGATLESLRDRFCLPSSEQLNLAAAGSQKWIVIVGLIGIVTVKISIHHIPAPRVAAKAPAVTMPTPQQAVAIIIAEPVAEPVIEAAPEAKFIEPTETPASAAPESPRSSVAVDSGSRVRLDYAFARERALARLRETDAYITALRELNETESRVQALRSDLSNKDLPEASVRWIRAKSVITGMERAALKADLEVQRTESAMRAGGYIQPTFPIRSNDRPDEPDLLDKQAAASN